MARTRKPTIPPADLWERIRAGFTLPEYRDAYVEHYEQWFVQHPKTLLAMTKRASRYLPYLADQLEQRSLPMELALLPGIESAYKPFAVSSASAGGLWQFIPATGRRFGLRQDWWYDGRFDVVDSTRAALDYLQFLSDEFDDDWLLAIAGYNSGEARIAREVQKNNNSGKPADFAHIRLLSETRRYVPKLIALRNIVRDPAHFGVALYPIPNKPYFAQVDANSQIDLKVVAKAAGVSIHEVRMLNPAYRQWVTPPNGPFTVLVPIMHKQQFVANERALSAGQRVLWARHRVRKGDMLGRIARRYRVSVHSIQLANHLSGVIIYPRQVLRIPTAVPDTAEAIAMAGTRARRAPHRRSHRVRHGDTLWRIARHNHVTVRQLVKWNSLSRHSTLKPGQKILIYK